MQFAYKLAHLSKDDPFNDFPIDLRNRIFIKIPASKEQTQVEIFDIMNQLSIRGRYDIVAVHEQDGSTIYGWEFYPPGSSTEDTWNYLFSVLREHIKEEAPLDRNFFEEYTFCL